MHNKILFGAIGLLLLGILGVGIYTIANNSQSAMTAPDTSVLDQGTQTPPTSSSTPPSSTGTTPGAYTMAQVAQHNSSTSCFTAINGSVYDLTSFIGQHPGGPQAILSLCGVDGTAAFMSQHGGQGRPEQELASLKIGTLAN